jgi:hypothetical protein
MYCLHIFPWLTRTCQSPSLPTNVVEQQSLYPLEYFRSLPEALLPDFVIEYGPVIDKENAGFTWHECLEAVSLCSGAQCLPTQWWFTCKLDGSAKPGW